MQTTSMAMRPTRAQPFTAITSSANHSPRILPRPSLARIPAKRTTLSISAAQQTTAQTSDDVSSAVSTLQLASTSPGSVPPTQVFNALRSLEQAKLPTEDWAATIGGSTSPGRRWRLVFTSGTKEVQKAMKGAGQGSGKYFPITAVQRWDATQGQIENGIFLGHLAALTFSGPYAMKGKKLSFDFDTLAIKLGPKKFSFNLKAKITNYTPSPKDPFFLFFYVGEDLVAARGRGGGVAFWARTSPAWELEKGVA